MPYGEDLSTRLEPHPTQDMAFLFGGVGDARCDLNPSPPPV